MKVVIAIAVLALAACSKSKCEKYGDMELKCGAFADNQEGRAMRLGFVKVCESSSSESSLEAAAAHFQKQADCADRLDDCAAYRKCVERLTH